MAHCRLVHDNVLVEIVEAVEVSYGEDAQALRPQESGEEEVR